MRKSDAQKEDLPKNGPFEETPVTTNEKPIKDMILEWYTEDVKKHPTRNHMPYFAKHTDLWKRILKYDFPGRVESRTTFDAVYMFLWLIRELEDEKFKISRLGDTAGIFVGETQFMITGFHLEIWRDGNITKRVTGLRKPFDGDSWVTQAELFLYNVYTYFATIRQNCSLRNHQHS
jgi:hypothetical protein